MTAFAAVWQHSSDGSSGERSDDIRHFCLPAGSTVSVENVDPLIDEFVSAFRKAPRRFARLGSADSFLLAMTLRWPCGGRGEGGSLGPRQG